MRSDVFLLLRFSSLLSLSLFNKNTWSDSIFAADVMGNSGMVECQLRLWDGVMEALMEGGAKPHNTVVLVLPQNQPTPSPQKYPPWNSLYFLHINVDPFESVRGIGWAVEELTFTKFPKKKVNCESDKCVIAISKQWSCVLAAWLRTQNNCCFWLVATRAGVKGVWQKLAVH